MQISLSNSPANPLLNQHLRGGSDPILALFANGEQGAYYDPSDSGTVFQDLNGGTTTPAGNGDPVGTLIDLSGNGVDATISDAAWRPQNPGLNYDGTDDGLRIQAGTSWKSARKDIFVLVRVDSEKWVPICSRRYGLATYIFAAHSGSTSSDISAPGLDAGQHFVNGLLVSSRDEVHSQAGTSWALLEVHNVDLSVWSQVFIGYYNSSGFGLQGDIGPCLFRDVMTTDERAFARQTLADKKGIALP